MSKTGRCEGVTVEGGAEIRAKCVVNSIGALPSFQMLRPHFPKACDKAIKRLESTDEPSVRFEFVQGRKNWLVSPCAGPRIEVWRSLMMNA